MNFSLRSETTSSPNTGPPSGSMAATPSSSFLRFCPLRADTGYTSAVTPASKSVFTSAGMFSLGMMSILV